MPQRPSPPEDLVRWTAVDQYFGSRLGVTDPDLEATLRESEAAGLPNIQVSPLQGKFLHLVARACRAERILEIGTLGGYSTTWLARALPPEGRLVTLELEPRHAAIARASLERAGLAERVEIRVGTASEGLVQLAREKVAPFDLVFIDADKVGYPEYLEGALRLSHVGTVIIADNVVRRGDVADPRSEDPNVRGVRQMTENMARDPRLAATVVQTVGVKGHDGWTFAVVVRRPPGDPSGRRSAVTARRNANKRAPVPARVRTLSE
jgi:predicted O-methyltransferase YrrM